MSRASSFPSAVPANHLDALQDPKRLMSLENTGLMDSVPEEKFDRVIRLASYALNVPVGLLALVDGKRQFFKTHRGLPLETAAAGGTPLSHSFCQYVVTQDKSLAVSDAREHPLLKASQAVPDLGVIAYLGVPIHAPDGLVLGSLCAIDSQARDWTDRDLDVLSDLADMIETELSLRDEARRRELLAFELRHRVKNLFSVVLSIVSLTARERQGQDDALATVHERIYALSLAHAVADDNLENRTTDLGGIVRSVLSPYKEPSGRVVIEGSSVTLPTDFVTPVALIMHELATNAAKYGALAITEGRVEIAWARSATAGHPSIVKLLWTESGVTNLAVSDTEGFGSIMVRSAAMQMMGSVEREWRADGLEVTITFPIAS